MSAGVLTISLDFELYWGVHDKCDLDTYRANIEGVHLAAPVILEVFSEYGIHATWATVGFLLCESIQELRIARPDVLPSYERQEYAPYGYIDSLGGGEDAACLIAPGLLAQIQETPHQEIGTHTWSHFYCLEAGVTRESMRSDMAHAKDMAQARGLELTSIVFPRNQYDDSCLDVCRELGVTCYRGNQDHFAYRPNNDEVFNAPWARLARAVDTYISLSGPNSFARPVSVTDTPLNIPASFFLRPFSKKLRLLEPLRLRRLKRAMSHAAKAREVCHLWWHPHNFGRNLDANIAVLRQLLDHYRALAERHGMESLNMGELAKKTPQSEAV